MRDGLLAWKTVLGSGHHAGSREGNVRHAFEDCRMQKVWIGYYEGNTKSKRVQEKCGFKYQWKSEDVDVPLMHEKRTGHVSLMTKEDWQEKSVLTLTLCEGLS